MAKQWILNSNALSFFTEDEQRRFYTAGVGTTALAQRESVKFRTTHGMVTDDGEGGLWCGDRIVGQWAEPPAPPQPEPPQIPYGYVTGTAPFAMPPPPPPPPAAVAVPFPPMPFPPGSRGLAPVPLMPPMPSMSAELTAKLDALQMRMDGVERQLAGIGEALGNLHNTLVSWFTATVPMSNPPPPADTEH